MNVEPFEIATFKKKCFFFFKNKTRAASIDFMVDEFETNKKMLKKK